MPESGLFGFLYRVTDVIYKLAWSNLLWFFTAGFPLVLLLSGDWVIPLALFLLVGPPGTAALFHVMREWLENEDVSVWKEYWRGWRKNWKRAYKVIDFYVLVGVLLVVDLVVVANAEQAVVKWIGYLLLPMMMLYVLTGVTLLPLLVRFQWKFMELVKNAFMMSVSHLFSSLAVLAGMVLVVLTAFRMMPPLAFFFFASFTAWGFTWQTNRIIERIKRIKDESEQNNETEAEQREERLERRAT